MATAFPDGCEILIQVWFLPYSPASSDPAMPICIIEPEVVESCGPDLISAAANQSILEQRLPVCFKSVIVPVPKQHNALRVWSLAPAIYMLNYP